MCIVFGTFAHLCAAVVGPSELLYQSSLEVASVAELETVESGPETQINTDMSANKRYAWAREPKSIASTDVL